MPDPQPDHADNGTRPAAAPALTVYWRPGCPYCASLRRRLRRHQVPADWCNIWHEPAAAAFVRSAAGGNETVPTVVVGGSAHVNPSWSQLRDLLTAEGNPPAAPLGWRERLSRWSARRGAKCLSRRRPPADRC